MSLRAEAGAGPADPPPPLTAVLAAAWLAAGPAVAGPVATLEPAEVRQGGFAVLRVPGAAGPGTVEAFGRRLSLYPQDGGLRTFVPIPLGARPGRRAVLARWRGGSSALRITVARRRGEPKLRIEGLTVSNESAAVMQAHHETLAAVLVHTGQAALWAAPLRPPVVGRISSPFGVTRSYGGTAEWPHRGVDFACPAGSPVIAPAAGVVVMSRRMKMYGNIVVLDHGQSVHTSFLHLTSREVETGQRVEQGQIIGTVGATGFATGPHLHFGTYLGTMAVDPLEVLARLP